MRTVRALTSLRQRWAPPLWLAQWGFCLLAGPALAAMSLRDADRKGDFLLDFHYAFRPAGQAVLSGASPYVPLQDLHAQLLPFVYPAVTAWIFVPFAALPYGLAAFIYFTLSVAVIWAGLAVLGVRDPRCYTVIGFWPMVLDDLHTGAVSGAIFLGIAVAWRLRDRAGGPVILALAAAVKLFIWPLGFWLLLTGRLRAAVMAALAGGALLVIPWAAIRWDGAADYPAMLRRLTAEEGHQSFALSALTHALGLPSAATYVLAAALVLPGLMLVTDPDPDTRDRGVITGCLVLALAVTPIIWEQYLVVLLLPIALVAPRLSWLWWVPALMLVIPYRHPDGSLFALSVFWAVTTVIAAAGYGLTMPRLRWLSQAY